MKTRSRSGLTGAAGGSGLRCAAAAVATVGAVALVLWNGALGATMVRRLAMNDFGRLYYSAVQFLAGAGMYGPTPATAMMVAGREVQFWNLNPPHVHLLLLPLARLSPATALALWTIASLVSVGVALAIARAECGLVLTARQCGLALLGVLAFAGTGAMIATGQLAWLLMLPVTLAWRAARASRWTRAAVWLGVAMSVKAFLLIFLVYLVIRGQRRAALVATLVAMGCFGAGVIVFGVAEHVAWLRALGSVRWQWAAMNASVSGVVTRLFSDSPYFTAMASLPGVIRPLALGIGAVVAVLTIGAVTGHSGPRSVNRSFVVLLLAALLISPLGWVYYWWLVIPPMVAMAVDWRTSPLPPRSVWLGAVAAPAFVWPLPAVAVLQPSALATATIGSVYFWGTLLVWLAVLLDGSGFGAGAGTVPR